jgi:hypothetical protein
MGGEGGVSEWRVIASPTIQALIIFAGGGKLYVFFGE